MAENLRAGTLQTYLVEHYRPGSAAAALDDLASRVRAAVDAMALEGRPIRFRHSTTVASDEALFCVIEAADENLVRLVYDRAGVTFERLSSARTHPS